jgi:predicted Rossmann fold flavoprotein
MDSNSVAIIGAGPAGCMAAYYAQENHSVTLFDFIKPLYTLLYTGGGRCNLAYEEYDFKELAKFYPRGEKFLYSVFSRFATGDTMGFFHDIGVSVYTQDDLRMFPTSNSAKDVREKFLKSLDACAFKKEKALEVQKAEHGFLLKTENNSYKFDKVVISVGGHAGFELAKNLGHTIIKPKPALTGLITKESLKPIQGVSLKAVEAIVSVSQAAFASEAKQSPQRKAQVIGDLLFTHEGISGPLAYTISSVCAREDYSRSNPLIINLNFLKDEIDLQELLNANSKKDIKNLISEFVPKSLAEYILDINKIGLDEKCHQINAIKRDLILKSLTAFELNVVSPAKDGEVVTSGGVCLDEINPKTMESKLVEGLYFAGEVIDVDGFCGGFNLQNCWSTGYVAGTSI